MLRCFTDSSPSSSSAAAPTSAVVSAIGDGCCEACLDVPRLPRLRVFRFGDGCRLLRFDEPP